MFDAGLAGVVCRHSRARYERCNRGHDQDVTAAVDQCRQSGADGVECSDYVDFNHSGERSGVGLRNQAVGAHTSVGQYQIDPSESRHTGGYGLFDSTEIADIGHHGDCDVGSEFGGELMQRFGVQIHQHESDLMAGQCSRRMRTDSPGRPRDQCDLSLQSGGGVHNPRP